MFGEVIFAPLLELVLYWVALSVAQIGQNQTEYLQKKVRL